jgi:hypothetical protein
MTPKKKLWDRLDKIRVSLKLRDVAIRLHEKVIGNFNNIEGYSKYINCNIGFKEGYPLSLTLFGICIDKLEDFL